MLVDASVVAMPVVEPVAVVVTAGGSENLAMTVDVEVGDEVGADAEVAVDAAVMVAGRDGIVGDVVGSGSG